MKFKQTVIFFRTILVSVICRPLIPKSSVELPPPILIAVQGKCEEDADDLSGMCQLPLGLEK